MLLFLNVTNSVVFSTGLDYVAHEDVVPYTSTETTTPICHELFDKFLMPSPENCKFASSYSLSEQSTKTQNYLFQIKMIAYSNALP